MNWTVGDEVIVKNEQRSWGDNQPKPGVVTAVRRKYFDVEIDGGTKWPVTRTFSKDNGHEQSDRGGYTTYGRCYPKALWEERVVRQDCIDALKKAGVLLTHGGADPIIGIPTPILVKMTELTCRA